MSDNKEWYYANDGQQAGPFSTEEMIGIIRSGIITSDTYIWHQKLGDWKTVRETEFASYVTDYPPMPSSPSYAQPAQNMQAQTMRCRNCGKEIYAKAAICVHCGVKPMNAKNYCQHCGERTGPTQEMCIRCGCKLNEGVLGRLKGLWNRG